MLKFENHWATGTQRLRGLGNSSSSYSDDNADYKS